MDLEIPPIELMSLLESIPPKSRCSVRELTKQLPVEPVPTEVLGDTEIPSSGSPTPPPPPPPPRASASSAGGTVPLTVPRERLSSHARFSASAPSELHPAADRRPARRASKTELGGTLS